MDISLSTKRKRKNMQLRLTVRKKIKSTKCSYFDKIDEIMDMDKKKVTKLSMSP